MSAPASGVLVPVVGTYQLEPAKSTIAFVTKHMFGLGTVKGTFALTSGTIDVADPVTASSVTAVADAASFDTGNPKRDKHVKGPDFLDAANNPTITFTSSAVTQSGGAWVLTGTLTARGVGVAVDFLVTSVLTGPDGLSIQATARVDRYAHSIVKSKGMAARYLDLELVAVASQQ